MRTIKKQEIKMKKIPYYGGEGGTCKYPLSLIYPRDKRNKFVFLSIEKMLQNGFWTVDLIALGSLLSWNMLTVCKSQQSNTFRALDSC